jgi:formate-dependent nitrite reductase membrane component NrfD
MPLILASAVFWQAFYLLSAHLSENNAHYKIMTRRKQIDWRMHVTSTLHALISSIGVIGILTSPEHISNPIHGYSKYAEQVFSITIGYFIWDIYVCITNFSLTGFQFMVHGVLAFSIVVSLLVFNPN